MKRWWLVGLVVFIVGLVATAPADWLGAALARQTGSRVLLANPSGTVWRGSGFLIVKQGEQTFDLGAVRWSLSPWSLFLLRLSTHMELTGDGMQGSGTVIAARTGAIAIDGLTLRANADRLSAVYPPLGFFAPTGQLEAVADSLTIERQAVTGSASVVWRAAGLNLTTVRPLGDYQLSINGTVSGLEFTLASDSKAALTVSGAGKVDLTARRVTFNGRAEASSHSESLQPLLNLIGRPGETLDVRAIALDRTLSRR